MEKKKSIASSGYGVANLSMSINVLTKKNVTPETLFKGGYKNKIYQGDVFSIDDLTSFGKIHGVMSVRQII